MWRTTINSTSILFFPSTNSSGSYVESLSFESFVLQTRHSYQRGGWDGGPVPVQEVLSGSVRFDLRFSSRLAVARLLKTGLFTHSKYWEGYLAPSDLLTLALMFVGLEQSAGRVGIWGQFTIILCFRIYCNCSIVPHFSLPVDCCDDHTIKLSLA